MAPLQKGLLTREAAGVAGALASDAPAAPRSVARMSWNVGRAAGSHWVQPSTRPCIQKYPACIADSATAPMATTVP